jgi:peptide/nickel transport system substrate-binding protein
MVEIKKKENCMNRNKLLTWFLAGVVITTCLFFASCSSTATTVPNSPTKTTVAPTTSSVTTSASTPTKPPTTTAAPGPQSGGSLNIIASSVPVLMPISAIPAPAAVYLLPVLEPLIGQSKDGLVPTKLATGWAVAPDGKSVTIQLRKGVKFQDGTDFNADAVKYNLDLEIGVRSEVASLKSVDVIDTYTVKLNLSSFSNTLLQQLAYVAGMMQSPTALKTNDKAWFSTHAIGTGPFLLDSFNSPTSLVFKKFTGYWDTGKPYLDELRWTFVVDPVTAELSFRSGSAQVWDQLIPANLKSISSLGLNVTTAPKTIWMAIGDSANSNSPFAKIQVRQAIDYAIDKKTVVNTFGFNVWEAPTQPISSKQSGYIPNFQGRTYDAAKAKQLLADAGYANGFNTKLTVRNNFDMNVIGAYQAYLKTVGINAEIVSADTGTYRQLLSKGWDGIIISGLGIAGSYAKTMESTGKSRFCTR